jgi:hypothetical protein
MMNESIFFGGGRTIGFGFALGDVGDLLAYRQEWEPFIAAHLALWDDLWRWLEANPKAASCPPGVFDASQIKDDTTGFCATLSMARARVSATNPLGIRPQWNAWKDKSSADIVAGAPAMLENHQNTVMTVGTEYAKDLIDIHKSWGLPPPVFPDVPSLDAQAELRARIEGAYITTKGVIQLIGYSASSLLGEARDIADATAKGLTDTARAIPNTAKWVAIAAGVTAVIVGGVLIAYYVPRRHEASSTAFRPALP